MPNAWGNIRYKLREPFAEFLGTAILVCFGESAVAQFVTEQGTRGEWVCLSLGWGLGIMLGVFISAGISGGHLNPAVTISLAVFRRFPIKKIPVYILAQLLGAFFGSLVVFGIWKPSIHHVESILSTTGSGDLSTNTVGIFVTGPQKDWTGLGSAFGAEVLGAACLLLAVAAVGDVRNAATSQGMTPFILLWIFIGISSAIGSLTGFAVNPARDFAPRVMASIVGYPSKIWSGNSYYSLWGPIFGPITGGFIGLFLYDALIYTGEDSIFNMGGKARSNHSSSGSRTIYDKEKVVGGHGKFGSSTTDVPPNHPNATNVHDIA